MNIIQAKLKGLSTYFNPRLKGSFALARECCGPDGRYWGMRTPFASFGLMHRDGCEEEGCQACCPHDEYDHYICLDCGHEKCPGVDIDAAMDFLESLE